MAADLEFASVKERKVLERKVYTSLHPRNKMLHASRPIPYIRESSLRIK
jgi:hypothetical protein